MQPRWHVLSGFVAAYIAVFFFQFSLFAGGVIFLASIFIDLDHLLIYYLKHKNIHPKKFLDWSAEIDRKWQEISDEEKRQYKEPQFILHGIEFLVILTILSFFHNFFFWILIGILVHTVLDIVDIIEKKQHYHPSIKLSQTWVWLRNRKKTMVFG